VHARKEWAWLPPDDALRLEAILRALGGSDAEIAEAAVTGTAGGLALDLALRDGRPPLTAEEAARAAGNTVEEFTRFWQALGFTDPALTEARVPAALVDALPVITAITGLLGEETSVGLARVIGSTATRLAESLADAFRVDFEVPELASGTSYSDVVARYSDIARTGLPALEAVLCAVLRAHLVRVASGAWSPDDEQAAARRELFVGFVDMVGYTALSRTLSPSELARLLGQFESIVAEVVGSRGGRLVKLIGDGAMFVADTPEAGCAIALALTERTAAAEAMPPVRVGGACGDVMSRYGDYFGDVVNLAARLGALANPSTVVVSDVVAAACEKSFGFEQLPPQALKGFHAPPVSYRLTAG
jgi:adenylate cyclase